MMTTDKTRHQDGSYDLALDSGLLLRIVWDARITVLIFIFSAAIVSVALALLLPNVYRAEAHLKPNSDDAGGGLAALAGQYGALASLAGINIADGSSDQTALGIAVLQSRKFITEFIARHDIKVELIAAKGWDEETRRVLIDDDIYDTNDEKWVRRSWFGRGGEPSLLESYEEFKDILQVRQDGDTGFIKISIDHYSPIIARQWVEWIIKDLNIQIMTQDVAEAERSIEYLEEQIRSTSLSELQSMFSRLIEKQLETVMLSEVTEEYLLKTIDPAMEPEEKHRPNRAMICVLGTFLGAVIGALFVIMRRTRLREDDWQGRI